MCTLNGLNGLKPRIAYAYYAVSFSKSDIKKLDKIISKITKKTCNIPKSTANILTHLPHENFGINMTSLLPDYVHCIGQQLIQTLNDPCQLGTIYQGLTKYITAKYRGSLHLPKLKQQACSRSPIARTLFLLKREYEIHVTTTNKAFPVKKTPSEITWRTNPIYHTLSDHSKIQSQKYLDKLYTYGITTLPQILNKTNTSFLTPEEFRITYKNLPKTIKAALQQAQILFPQSQQPAPQITPQIIQHLTHNTDPNLNPILGKTIHKIIKEKTTTRKDKGGAQAIKKTYLCQWQTTNNTTHQWRTEEDLLHPDNIFLTHNLLTITQYHTATTTQNTTNTYTKYLTNTQTNDTKFIHPPLTITNLTLNIHECNPDKDIITNKPSITTHALGANIYDQKRNFIATLTLERLHWLWNQFSHNTLQHLTNFLQPPPQDFETEILWLLQIYITILPKKKPKIIQPNNLHQTLPSAITKTLPSAITKTLIESFQITHSYYSSPLTCPTQLTQYNSPHTRDILFGSRGKANSTKWTGHGLAFPTDHNTTLEALHWARMAAKEDAQTLTILIINHKDWTPQQIPLINHDIHILATIPPHTIIYNPTPKWPKYYQYTEPSLTSIICVHNQDTILNNTQIPTVLQRILKNTIHTHIDTHPIKSTPTHYNVKFSNAWKNAPKTTPPQIINTNIIPLPSTFTHTYPLKFHPQQCTYTDGSFIPPTINSEGHIEGNTAGSGVYSPNNNTKIAERLPGYQNILKAELNAILLAVKNIQLTKIDTHIFTDSLNSIYLINNHIHRPTSQHHHPDKLLIAAIVRQIYWTPHKIHIHKVRAHTGITGNEIADELANEGGN
jgi:ribonuclease HI